MQQNHQITTLQPYQMPHIWSVTTGNISFIYIKVFLTCHWCVHVQSHGKITYPVPAAHRVHVPYQYQYPYLCFLETYIKYARQVYLIANKRRIIGKPCMLPLRLAVSKTRVYE